MTANTYSLTVTDNNGCTNTVSAIVTEPATSVSGNAASVNATCGAANGGASVNATGGTGAFAYLWSNGATSKTASNIIVGSYSVTITDANGCTTVTATAVGNTSTLSAATTPGSGCPPTGGSASVTASLGSSPYTYLWSTSSTAQTISNLSSATYTVTVTDASACVIMQTVTVANYSNPLPSAGNDVTITQNNSTVLAASGGTSYSWAPSTGLSNIAISNPIASPTITTTYTVIVTDNNGCTAMDIMTVFVDIDCGAGVELISIPTAFSPNGDGQNDYLQVKAGACLKDFKLSVFNRWGQKVFETSSVNTKWDGMYNGEIANSGVYVFILNATSLTGDKIEKQGDVALIK